ncbi:hypothetical protein [Bradyrhizobium sp. Leo170]|uniref:hypothetical protein n=1 Tax=Bradyrhizobium sp. Leo170 TaxID=1571199 RepID=UPI001A919520|nr:hypothetical protein [Bradyrhizobium sp. Leo170]
MIQDEDVHFHKADAGVPNWAETNFFGFFNAEATLNVGVYALFRPNLGIVSSTICMNSGFANTPWEADFCDLRASIPIPEPRDLSDFSLENSLRIKCLRPNMDWHIGYDDGEGTTIDVEYRSIMLPFDIHDPVMDPMKAKALKEAEQGANLRGVRPTTVISTRPDISRAKSRSAANRSRSIVSQRWIIAGALVPSAAHPT